MRPNAWGESFIYEIWPAAKYRNIAPNGAFETLGIIKLPDNKDVLYKTLIDLARLPFRAAPWAFDEKYLGINKETLLQLEQNMKKHYDPSFVEEFMSLMYSNLEKYEKEYILRIHETRFFNYLYEEIKTLKTDVSKLRNFLTNEPAFLNALNKCRDKKILFWGASVFLKEFLNRNNLSDFNIVGIIDKNTKNNDSKLGKYSVYPPEEIKNINADLIISSVTNSHDIVHNQIKEFLQNNDIKLELAPDTFA